MIYLIPKISLFKVCALSAYPGGCRAVTYALSSQVGFLYLLRFHQEEAHKSQSQDGVRHGHQSPGTDLLMSQPRSAAGGQTDTSNASQA